MIWSIFLSTGLALEVPVPNPQKGFEQIRFRFGGFVQPRFGYSPDDEEGGVVGQVGFSVRRVRLENYVDLISTTAIYSKVSLELMPEARLVDAYINVKPLKLLQLRFGQQ